MFLKIFIFIIINTFLLQNGNLETCNMDDVYLHFFGQIESVKKSVEILNTRLDIISDKNFRSLEEIETKNLTKEKSRKTLRPIFDIRYDALPEHCATDKIPINCAEATECTRTSGIYNITDTRYRNHTFTVNCDCNYYEGDWLYILRRVDGSENFNRPWSDYVNGFGNVAGEYWIGLENLYALTNYYGPQELNVYMENFEGRNVYARYDNFVIGNASELYQLKSLGRYYGTAGDSLYNQLSCQFSTYDKDNDKWKTNNCAVERNGGFWFKECSSANPTGKYLRGKYTNHYQGLYWKTFEGESYSHKTIFYMIRRQTAMKFN